MRFHSILPLAALGSAFIIPQQELFDELSTEDHHDNTATDFFENVSQAKDDVLASLEEHLHDVTEQSKTTWEHLSEKAGSALDNAFSQVAQASETFGDKIDDVTADIEQWVQDHGGHHGGHHGKHPHHPHKPNQTVYQMIASSKYTTKLAKLISEYDDIVEALNSTKANYTVFAPSDKVFEKIPEHAHKPSKEQLKAILLYHVVPDLYPAGRVLASHTAPTLLKGEHLSSKPEPQRIAFKLGLRGLTVNFYSRIFPINIFATNGVIHGVDSLIIPPPNAITLIDLFPGEFSTLELGLSKTGLLDKLNTTDHPGGTLFAPSNFAFQKLGPKINAFLFSQYGLKYLKALLEYHVVPGTTLYSDAIYESESSSDDVNAAKELPRRGHFHIDLPTLLDDRQLSVDIGRFGGFISVKVNGFASVSVQDGIAQDGVIQVVRDVLIPPKKIADGSVEHWDGSELSIAEFMERFDPYTAKQDL